MSKKDFRSSLIWLVFSIGVCIESYRLGMATLRNPGPGLYPFGIGLIMAIISLIVLFSSILGEKGTGSAEEPEEKVNKRDLILVVILLFLYAVILERLGFVLSTLFFIIFILTIIEKKRWYTAISFAVLATVMIYAVFNLWLDSNLPRGILGP
jgi:putative tricarboxylic transport membrane protein